MPEEITESSNELNDASKDRDIATLSDSNQSTVDTSQDVDSQERIRSNSVAVDASKNLADVENQRRDRLGYDQLIQQTMRQNDQLHAIVMQGLQNMVSNAEMAKNQNQRHVDHTATDLHGSDVNPGATPQV